jgi:hypothetical protein
LFFRVESQGHNRKHDHKKIGEITEGSTHFLLYLLIY